MKTLGQIDVEIDRLKRVNEYLGYTLSSLTEKRNKIEGVMDSKMESCPIEPIFPSEYLELESRIYSFIDDNSPRIDFVDGVKGEMSTPLVGCANLGTRT